MTISLCNDIGLHFFHSGHLSTAVVLSMAFLIAWISEPSTLSATSMVRVTEDRFERNLIHADLIKAD